MKTTQTLLTTHTYTSTTPGPHLLILGAIHGNEPAGTLALTKLLHQLHTSELSLSSGTLTCIPICNPDAYEEHVRYITHNLNRIIRPGDQDTNNTPLTREQQYASEICAHIQNSDLVLDIHTSHRSTPPYVFQDYDTDIYAELARATQIQTILTGRPTLYEKKHTQKRDYTDSDTISYAHSLGKAGVTVECGGHTDPDIVDIAYMTIRHTLDHYGVLPYTADDLDISKKTSHTSISMQQMYSKTGPGTFTHDRQDLTPVSAGTIIATYNSGETITAPSDGYIILPYADAQIGDEWVYFGI